MMTLKQIRMVCHGHLLQQGDLDFANELLQWHTRQEVMAWVKSWAQQYANDIKYESGMVKDFERNAYGN